MQEFVKLWVRKLNDKMKRVQKGSIRATQTVFFQQMGDCAVFLSTGGFFKGANIGHTALLGFIKQGP